VAGGFGFFHAAVGQEVAFAVFYILPVAAATWYVGRTAGIIMAGICGIVALGADLASGQVYSQEWIPVFNAIVVTGFFIITAYALAHLRGPCSRRPGWPGRTSSRRSPTSAPFTRRFPTDSGMQRGATPR
jgi:hypothetical protein